MKKWKSGGVKTEKGTGPFLRQGRLKTRHDLSEKERWHERQWYTGKSGVTGRETGCYMWKESLGAGLRRRLPQREALQEFFA